MKKTTVAAVALLLLNAGACKKASDSLSQISLTPSSATATVGQTISVALNSDATASKWSVTPATATKTYTITAAKLNYFTFSQPGVYTISVSAKSVALDSASTHTLDSCWNSVRHNCRKDIDSASVAITVTK